MRGLHLRPGGGPGQGLAGRIAASLAHHRLAKTLGRSVAGCLLAVGLNAPAHGAAEPLETLCLDCHRGDIAPKIEGQQAEYLALQLRRFRDHHRESFPMSAVAGAFDDDDASRWSRELSVRPWQDSRDPDGSSEDRRAGAELVESRGCTTCHGPALLGADEVPRLAGQHAHYLERQVRDFALDDRFHAPLAGGRRMRALEAEEIRQISAYAASLTSTPQD